jgi:hypothetical protein
MCLTFYSCFHYHLRWDCAAKEEPHSIRSLAKIYQTSKTEADSLPAPEGAP